MVKKLILIILLGACFHVKAQTPTATIEVEDHSIAAQLYTKCFPNLNQGAAFFEKYPNFERKTFCSLLSCSYLLSYKETEIQQAAEDLLRGITIQLYREGNPVYMISGMESGTRENKENENLEDDNHLVYISFGECVNPPFLHKAAKIINQETHRLINQSKL
ncbi:hypothetical protein GKZ90_0025155 [Flavobacterium sp. MC2016-06]|jgi:hypothetical protein|uniref:hypothetical protein n=1 Tax=Flavobacterium sp. MC2016-06 TaxID=2676308 RepID=UPI0012BB0557|nr:hypothetical protein [Flavobacterium sp. MC2016-06]MBU3862341.1 hypothetical protein [Flavobacterium sp. MC2016-06]